MSSRSRLTHWQRPEDTPPGGELEALATVYCFILDCRAKKVALACSKSDANGKDRPPPQNRPFSLETPRP
jgi:hypothetical protein